MAEERVYTIPLKKAWNSAYHKRTKRAIRIIKEFAMRHMKVEKVKISTELNKKIWERGNAHPPRRVKVIIRKEKEEAMVDLFVEKENKKEAKKEERIETKENKKEVERENKKENKEVPNKEIKMEKEKKENKDKTTSPEQKKNEKNKEEK